MEADVDGSAQKDQQQHTASVAQELALLKQQLASLNAMEQENAKYVH